MPTTIPARCRHLHTDGRQCGSPALRGHPLCYQHRAAREPLPVKHLDGRLVPQLPAPDDFPAIQRGIAEVIRLLAEEEITDRRASTLLRGLALAGQNLSRTLREARRQAADSSAEPVTDLVNHPELGPLALPPGEIPIQQNQDLSPLEDIFPTPKAVILSEGAAKVEGPAVPSATTLRTSPPLEPVPTPVTRFTPSSGLTPADDEKLGAFYLDLSESFSDKRRAFIREKTAELEAEFHGKLEAALANRLHELEARFTPQPEHELQLAAA